MIYLPNSGIFLALFPDTNPPAEAYPVRTPELELLEEDDEELFAASYTADPTIPARTLVANLPIAAQQSVPTSSPVERDIILVSLIKLEADALLEPIKEEASNVNAKLKDVLMIKIFFFKIIPPFLYFLYI